MEIDHIDVWGVVEGQRASKSDAVVCEAEVHLRLNGRLYRRFFCLPTHLEELALGHFTGEGIAAPSDINIEGSEIYCGGKGERVRPKKIASQVRVTEGQIFDWVGKLDENCPLYHRTGGTHVVGVFHGARAFLVEDISRHCAIDKAIGLALKNGMELSHSALATSCRQTLSTITKVINARIPIVITVSATTAPAIAQAHRFGVTLVGFARNRQFNIYSNDWRIVKD